MSRDHVMYTAHANVYRHVNIHRPTLMYTVHATAIATTLADTDLHHLLSL